MIEDKYNDKCRISFKHAFTACSLCRGVFTDNFAFFSAAVSVEPTYSYYEKVSEELERIVHEVQEKEEVQYLSDGEKLFSLQSSKKSATFTVLV